MGKIAAVLAENKVLFLLLVLGIFLIGVGGAKMVRESQGVAVEIIEPDKELTQAPNQGKVIAVDVAGAVASPSVYLLDEGVIIAGALAAAGGLGPEADSEWVAQHLNQAEKLKDGMKIYIPFQGETVKDLEPITKNQTTHVAGATSINVNTATESELDSLWGIGEARAKEIINNRPYGSLEELTTKAGISTSILEKNKGQISVY